MKDCVFCRIALGMEQASRVYEDSEVMAFLDARPVNEGHTLVICKKHYENIFEIPDDKLAYLFKVVKKVASAIVKSEDAQGIRIVQNNGAAAHQIIFHFHVHIIPEFGRHDMRSLRATPPKGELDSIAAKIRTFI